MCMLPFTPKPKRGPEFASPPSASSAPLLAILPINSGSTDDADATDGVFGTRAQPDHSRPCTTFPEKCDLDAQRPEKRLRAPQPTGQRSRRFWPTGASLPNLVTGGIGCT